MNTTLHVGHHITQSVTWSGGNLPPASVGVAAAPAGIVSISIDGGNNVTLTGLTVGSTVLTYSAGGFGSVTDAITVLPPPSLIVTDGPEV